MHDCVVKLLKSNDEEAFECLCKLLVTIGKDLDHEKAKVCTVNVSCSLLSWHVRNVTLSQAVRHLTSIQVAFL